MDMGPLSWVKNEINTALEQASQKLSDPEQFRQACASIQQARGALSIVGLAGVTEFAEAIEQLLAKVEQGALPWSREGETVARNAIAALTLYLDALIAGSSNQPLRLFNSYRALFRVQGLPEPSASELFFPDLTQRPPRRDRGVVAKPSISRDVSRRAVLLGFERALQRWRQGEARRLTQMRNCVAIIEQGLEPSPSRTFWWAVLALLDAITLGGVPNDAHLQQLLDRIETQIRKLHEGSNIVAERLLRDVLYLIAVTEARSDQIVQVRSVYHLDDLLPPDHAGAEHDHQLLVKLHAIREEVPAIEADWDRFSSGLAAALIPFHERSKRIAELAAAMDRAGLARIADAIANIASFLRKDPLAHNDSHAIEVATALLVIESAVGTTDRPLDVMGPEFTHQAEVVACRLDALRNGRPLTDLESPRLEALSSAAQDKQMTQVIKEILSNLGQVEQILDGFFRNPADKSVLPPLDPLLAQVSGALQILDENDAADLVKECRQSIETFAATEARPASEDFALLARQLSALGFYVEQRRHGAASLSALIDSHAAQDQEVADQTVEDELVERTQRAQDMAQALEAAPENETLRAELRTNLEALREDAQLTASTEIEAQATAALEVMEDAQPARQIGEAVAALTHPASIPVSPSAATSKLAAATDEVVDAEMLAIFLEEAQEVMATLSDELARLNRNPDDKDIAAIVRRCFHTLKGSSRMVNLSEFGEAAWAVEQVLNRQIKIDQTPGPLVLDMLEYARSLFNAWVGQLLLGHGSSHDASELFTRCTALLSGETSYPVTATAVIEAVPEPAPEVLPPPLVDAFDETAAAPQCEATTPFTEAQATVAEPEDAAEEPPLVTEHGASLAADKILPLVIPVTEELPVAVPLLPSVEAMTESLLATGLSDETGPTGGDEAATPEARIGNRTLSATLHRLYVEEGRGHLGVLERELFLIRLQPPRSEMVRAAHTLGSTSGTVGVQAAYTLGQALERSLTHFAASNAAYSEEQAGIVTQAVAALRRMIEAVAVFESPEGDEVLSEQLFALEPVQPLSATPERKPELAGEQLQLTDDLDEQVLPLFLEEAETLMVDIGKEFRRWREILRTDTEQLQRLLHTLKGSARMAGAMIVGELVHHLEAQVIEAPQPTAPQVLEELEASNDRIAALIEALRSPGTALAAAAPVLTTAASATRAQADIPETEAETTQRAQLRVRADLVDRLVNEAGEMAISRSRVEGEMTSLKSSLLDLTENVMRLRTQLRELEIQAEAQIESRQAEAQASHTEFDPLEMDRFTRSQELTRMMAESVNDVATIQQALLRNLDSADGALNTQARINRAMSQNLMSVRMTPFHSLADRLHRVVRQTAKELGYRANLEIVGGATELDRSVLEAMLAPIEHLLRNSIAHGLEPRDLRREIGKPEQGEITVSVSQDGNEVLLAVSDDGSGLDLERIRAVASERGLIEGGEDIDPRQLAQVIFQTGFSTAREITTTAGRGVGLDVVRNEVASLGGRIEVDSRPGLGVTFRIHLPVTLALTQGVLVRAGEQLYAIPSTLVQQASEFKPEAIERIRATGSAEWLGQQYTWRYLPNLLGDPQAQPVSQRRHWLIFIKGGTNRIAIEVDDLIGGQEIVVKNVGPQLARVAGIAGATILSDGQVVLILNPNALSERQQLLTPVASKQFGVSTIVSQRLSDLSKPLVLVVDDSLTVRKITSRLLERADYRVITAKDGVDALEKITDIQPDVVLTDIEMPRMDGFDLTRAIRADARLRHLPIIVISSRSAEKHREHAASIGINHFLGKPFAEDELLHVIGSYLTGEARH